MDVCVENGFTAPPPMEALRRGLGNANLPIGVAQGFSPEDSSESSSCSGGSLDPSPKLDAPQTETAGKKSVGGLGVARTLQKSGSQNFPTSCTWMWTRFSRPSSRC